MARTVRDFIERLRGVTLTADEAQEIIHALETRVRDTGYRLLEMKIQSTLYEHRIRSSGTKLDDEQALRLFALILPHLEDNTPHRQKALEQAMRVTSMRRHFPSMTKETAQKLASANTYQGARPAADDTERYNQRGDYPERDPINREAGIQHDGPTPL